MPKGLYDAYIAGAAANIEYRENLYEAEQSEQEISGSRQMFAIGEQQRNVMIGTISEGLSSASNLYGGYQAKKERAAEIEGLGKSKWDESRKDIEGHTRPWEELSAKDRAEYTPQQTYGETKLWDLLRGKADIGEGETKWGEAGERLNVLFGGAERRYDWQGMDWTGSELSAKAKLERASERGLSKDEGEKTKIEELQEKFKEEEKKEVEEEEEVEEIGVKTMADENGIEDKKFGSDFLDQPNYYLRLGEDEMSKMMEIYKGRKWDPSKEKWYDPTRASEFGWTGKWQ